MSRDIGCGFRFSSQFPQKREKKKEEEELVWLCIGFLCAVASINPQCGLVSVWKHVSACGKKVCWRECGSYPKKTGCTQPNIFLYIHIYIYVLVRGLLLMLSHVVMDQVWKSAEAASPSHLPTSDLCFRTFSVAGSTHDTVLMLG